MISICNSEDKSPMKTSNAFNFFLLLKNAYHDQRNAVICLFVTS